MYYFLLSLFAAAHQGEKVHSADNSSRIKQTTDSPKPRKAVAKSKKAVSVEKADTE